MRRMEVPPGIRATTFERYHVMDLEWIRFGSHATTDPTRVLLGEDYRVKLVVVSSISTRLSTATLGLIGALVTVTPTTDAWPTTVNTGFQSCHAGSGLAMST